MNNPFWADFAQAILDSIVKSAWSIFSAETMSIVLPFMIKMGMIATVVFWLISLFFTFFGYIRNKGMGYIDDNIDWFIWSRVSGRTEERLSNKSTLPRGQKTTVWKVVNDM